VAHEPKDLRTHAGKLKKPARYEPCRLLNSGCVSQGRYSSRRLETDQQFNGSSAGKRGARFVSPRDLFIVAEMCGRRHVAKDMRPRFMRPSRHDPFSKCALNDAQCGCRLASPRWAKCFMIDSRIAPQMGRWARVPGPVSKVRRVSRAYRALI
jgi:hypothetical protein